MVLAATSSIDPPETIGLESHIWLLVQSISKFFQGLCLDIQATTLDAAYNRFSWTAPIMTLTNVSYN